MPNQANGWIKLHRKLLDWEWSNNPNVMCLFIHLLLSANHEPGTWQGVEVKPGQIITSLPKLAQKTGLTLQQTRTALSNIQTTGEITGKSTNKYRLITIKKWHEYQSVTDKITLNEQTNNRQNRKPVTPIEEAKKKELSLKDRSEAPTPLESMNEGIDRSFPRKRLYGDEAFNWLLDYFEHKFSREPLDTEKWSRVFLKHLKGKVGLGKVREIIDWASNPDCWWYSRLTGFKLLYYKRDMILKSMEADAGDKEKAKKPYIDGDRAYQNERGDWMIIPRDGGQHLTWGGSKEAIEWR